MDRLEKIFSFTDSDKDLLEIDFLEYIEKNLFHFPLKVNLKGNNGSENIFVCDIGGSILKFAYFENEKLIYNENKKIQSKYKKEEEFFTWILSEIKIFINEYLNKKKYQSILILSYDIRYNIGYPYVIKYSKYLNGLNRENFNIQKFFDNKLKSNFFTNYINDSPATLLTDKLNIDYFNISLIYGTGINISFFHDNIIKITEIANFASEFLPVNEFDKIIFNEQQLKNEKINYTELMTANFLLDKYLELIQNKIKTDNLEDITKIFYERGFKIIVFLLE